MARRHILVGVAAALGVGIFFVTIRWGPAGALYSRRESAPVDPGDLRGLQGMNPRAAGPLAAQRYFYDWVNRKGQLIEVQGRSVQPLGRGEQAVVEPIARIHLTPRRILEIRGERGRIQTPEQHPESGVFEGLVRLTVFESRGPTRPVLGEGSPDIALRLFLDEGAAFDLQLGRVSSEGPVHLTLPEVDFRGRGLDVRYNDVRGRIDRLEVARGHAMRVHTASRRAPSNPVAAGPATPGERAAAQSPRASLKPVPDKAPADPLDPQGRRVQPYRATLNGAVTLTRSGSRLWGDQVDVFFLAGGESAGNPASQAAPAPSKGPHAGAPAAAPSTATQATTTPHQSTPGGAASVAERPSASPDSQSIEDRRSITPRGEEDVHITWSGSLTLVPEDDPPSELNGPQDLMLVMVGRPVRLLTDRRESVVAGSLQYDRGADRLDAIGSLENPLVIDSPELGVIHGRQLTVERTRGRGVVLGPGTIRSRVPGGDAGSKSESLAVRWRGPLRLEFDGTSGPATSSAPAPTVVPAVAAPQLSGKPVGSLRTATFVRDVEVQHAEFDLTSDELTVLVDPLPGGRHAMRRLTAAGSVRVRAKPAREEEALDVDSDRLEAEMAISPLGRSEPSWMIASGNVFARQPGRNLRCGLLDLRFRVRTVAPLMPSQTEPELDPLESIGKAPRKARLLWYPQEPLPAEPPSAPRPAQPLVGPEAGLALRRLVAAQAVRVESDEQRLVANAHELIADFDAQRVDLHAAPGKQVSVRRGDGTVYGTHLTLLEQSQGLAVHGPGSIEFAVVDRPADAPAQPAQPAGRSDVHVAWSRSMRFDQSTGRGQFEGDVRASSMAALETRDLRAQSLALQLRPAGPRPNQRPEAGVSGDPGEASRSDFYLDSLLARGDVALESESWADRARRSLLNRMRLAGGELSYADSDAALRVPGPGTLLLQDERATASDEDNDPANRRLNPASAVRIEGRGKTLFVWTQAMRFNLRHNDLRLDRGVQVVHEAAGSKEVTQLDADSFDADLEVLPASAGGRELRPRLMAVVAAGSDEARVRLIAGERRIEADRLRYSGPAQRVQLDATPPRSVFVQQGDQAPLTARAIVWELLEGRFRIADPGAQRSPGGLP